MNGVVNDKKFVSLVGLWDIGKGVELALAGFPDMEGIAVFTRRNAEI